MILVTAEDTIQSESMHREYEYQRITTARRSMLEQEGLLPG
jgi:hypothetical protein